MTDCINLRERFGAKYRVTYDECYEAEHGERGRTEDPWLMQLSGRFGHVFPWGANTIAVSVDGRPKVASIIRRLPFVTIEQDGDDGELTVSFAPENLPKVAKIVKLHRKPRLTEAQRQANAARLAAWHYKPNHAVTPDLAREGSLRTA